MEAKSKFLRISPKKVNLVAGLVRRKSVIEALNLLKFTPKKGARLLAKVIHSASTNATQNFKQHKDNLYVEQIIVDKGPTLKRSIPVSRGRAHPILKRTAHIKVKVGVLSPSPEKNTKPSKKTPAPKNK